MATNETKVFSSPYHLLLFFFWYHVGKVRLLDKIEKFVKVLGRRRLEISATSSILFPFKPQQHISSPSFPNKSRLAYKEKVRKKLKANSSKLNERDYLPCQQKKKLQSWPGYSCYHTILLVQQERKGINCLIESFHVRVLDKVCS